MKHRGRILISELTGLLLNFDARAAASESRESPYGGIATRNVFDLRPTTSLASARPSPSAAAIPKISLTGITTILGRKIVFLTVRGAGPTNPPEFLMLAEGEAKSGIEVKHIDENAGDVRVVNHGEEQIVSFDRDGIKASEPTGLKNLLCYGSLTSQPAAPTTT